MLTISAKCTILDVWHGSEYASNTLMYILFTTCFAIKVIQTWKKLQKNNFNRHFNLLYTIFSNLHTKASALNWIHLFYKLDYKVKVMYMTNEKNVLKSPNIPPFFFVQDSQNNACVVFLKQPAFNCSKLTTETLEKAVKYVQS